MAMNAEALTYTWKISEGMTDDLKRMPASMPSHRLLKKRKHNVDSASSNGQLALADVYQKLKKNGPELQFYTNTHWQAPEAPTQLMIANLHVEPETEEDGKELLAEAWKVHQPALKAILRGQVTETNSQILFELCRNVCCLGQAQPLYQLIHQELLVYIKELTSTLAGLAPLKGNFLKYILSSWTKLTRQLAMVRNIFSEVDRLYVMRCTSFSSIIHLGETLFCDHVMANMAVRERVVANITYLITRERNGYTIDRPLIKSLLAMLHELGLYHSIFESRLIEETSKYYRKEATELLQTMSAPDYLSHVAKRREEESLDRSQAYLLETTRGPLVSAVLEQLVYTRVKVILDTGFDAMMENDEKIPLRMLYDLLRNSKEMVDLRQAFIDHVKRHGTAIMEKVENANLMDDLMRYKARMEEIVASVFDLDPLFVHGLTESFESFVNNTGTSSAYLIAAYIDNKLRTHAVKASQVELQSILDNVLVIFRYVQGKDAFEVFYKQFLAKRLLTNQNPLNAVEKHILNKLKEECGPDFTEDMEAMFRDIADSVTLSSEYKKSSYRLRKNDQFKVYILTQSIWPTAPHFNIVVPPQLLSYQASFEKFYNANNRTTRSKGRRLTWTNSLTTCVLQANFPNGTKELLVTLFQAVILLLFNDRRHATLSFTDIAEKTQLDPDELKWVLQSLACTQFKVLKKEPRGLTIRPTDLFHYNLHFTSPISRIKFSAIHQQHLLADQKRLHSPILLNRQHQIDAFIVRTLKQAKSMTHANLTDKLKTEFQYSVETAEIRARIEDLIVKDYLKRDSRNRLLYHYQS
ncbi:Cullin family-domain-containing protein [Radiomyces spectabilis]|uniref:Cullin family-domain-containing protein n=1 Tax=Radiomyces spectabilis TaxID=64574 RepID=UPI00221F2510|nr:Cullin family-domain-containing protein [Radiomyces spectabilis]KAI8373145.1 Cullin family-domain-containing protein [Radiomyces spectabilis]